MPLKATQRWLQTAVTSATEPNAAERHILPSATLTPAQRVGVYRELYPARLVAALKADYPLLCQALSGEVFTQLALFYAQAHPSRSFTLNDFGLHLPEFLIEVQGLPRPRFHSDLALFERACSSVFHAAEAAPLSPQAITQVPLTAWDRARLRPIPALRLLALAHPVHRYAEGITKIRKQPSFLAVYRRNYNVAWLPLTPVSYRVLTALTQGQTMGSALNGAHGPAQRWFTQWMAAGLFQSIQLD